MTDNTESPGPEVGVDFELALGWCCLSTAGPGSGIQWLIGVWTDSQLLEHCGSVHIGNRGGDKLHQGCEHPQGCP